MRTAGASQTANRETSRFPRKERLHMPGSLTTPGRPGPRDDAPRRIAFRLMHGVGTQNRTLSRLNGWPMHAESAQGISPRAAHRSGRDTLASSGSCHRWKATAFRREMGLLPSPDGCGWPAPTAVPPPFAPRALYPLHRYYEAVRPSPAHQYFRPHGWCRLCLFPLHRRPGSQVPYESQDESHASCTPDTAWLVSRLPPCSSRNQGNAPILVSSNVLSMLQQRFACARLSHPYMTRSMSRLLTMTFTTAAFDRSSSWQFEASSYKAAPKGRPSSLVQHSALALS